MVTPRKKEIPKRRGRPATGKDPTLTFRSPIVLTAAIGKAAAKQSDKPSRSKMLRRIVSDWLMSHGFLEAPPPAPDEIAAKIERLDAKAAALDVSGPASPQRAMNAMDKALTKGRAKGLRNKLAKAKGGKTTP